MPVGFPAPGEILAAHDLLRLDHTVFTQFITKNASDFRGQLRIVGQRRSPFGDLDQRFLRPRAHRGRFGLSLDPIQQLLADFVRIAANGQLQVATIGNDVVFGAGVERTNSDDACFSWWELPADNGLQRKDDLRAQHDRVDTTVRAGAMCANTVHDDIDGVCTGHGRADRGDQFTSGYTS